jgi:hypothetical protein
MFGGEQNLLDEALYVSREFFSDAVGAVSDSPWGAQALSAEKPNSISLPTCELGDLQNAALSRLHQLEGLIAWPKPQEIGQIVDFFHTLGIHRLGEIRRFQVDSFRERWQDTGTAIWKRLHGLDKQVISPLLPSESLQDFVYLDFPVSLLPFLLHCIEKSLQRLLARLQGRSEYARKILLHLFCEYSEEVHQIELQPSSPARDLDLFMKLIENKLSHINLDNPIQQFEISVLPCPERTQQMSMFEPRVSDQDKLSQLVSVFNQADLTTGFLKPKDEIWPEDSWEITSEFENYSPGDHTISIEEQSFQIKPSHSSALSHAPRPSRLLKKPKALSRFELERFQFLSSLPIERMEDSWWNNSRGRDYYFALSNKGEFTWIFHDRIENQYYLHGYFD